MTNTTTPVQPSRSYILWGTILLVVSILIRIWVYPVTSWDFISSVSHWLDALSSPGLSAFQTPFSDYAPLYLYFLKVIAVLPFGRLFSVKTLSLIFDVILGLMGAAIVKTDPRRTRSSAELFLVFSVIFIIPTVILNSSAWAQADAIYTAFVLMSLYFILRDRPLGAGILFGIALSFKLQAIFFLPILVAYLLVRKGDWKYLFSIPIVYIITIIPAWLGGGSLWQLLGVYGQQSSEFQALSLSAPTVFSFLNENGMPQGTATFLSYIGIVITLVVAGVIVRWMILEFRRGPMSLNRLIGFSLLSVIALPFFLPHMHERYFYLADVVSVIYVFLEPRRWYLPILIIGASLFSYFPFLSGSVWSLSHLIISEWILGLVMLIALTTVFLLLRLAPAQQGNLKEINENQI